jgi:hypothetical protein
MRSSATFHLRGEFILRKLRQHDETKLQIVLDDVFREEKDPQDFTEFEWKVVLEHMGASPEEVWGVQQRMGRRASRSWPTSGARVPPTAPASSRTPLMGPTPVQD